MIEPAFGGYEYDSSNDARIIINEGGDKHYHYIVLDNTIKSTHNNVNSGDSRAISFATATQDSLDVWGLPLLNEDVRPLAKYGNMRTAGGLSGAARGNCAHSCVANSNVSAAAKFQGPISWTYPRNGALGSSNCHGLSATGGYILSGSSFYKNSSSIYDNAGSLPLDNYVRLLIMEY